VSDFDDLIGIPFELGGRTLAGLDCAGLALEVLRRLGEPTPELPASESRSPAEAVEAWGDAWVRVGDRWADATMPGDVIVLDPGMRGRSAHLAVVAEKWPRRVLETTIGQSVGSAKCYDEGEVVGVYRPRKQALVK
jgi:cell wall-associated NlpC family hydrolase